MAKFDAELVALLEQSELFDGRHYAQHFDAEALNRREQIHHYLTEGERIGLSPSPLFDPRFYLETYRDLADTDSGLAHFIRWGRAEGRYGTLAGYLIGEGLDQVAIEDEIIPDPKSEDATAEAYEIAVGQALASCENDNRYFSSRIYLDLNPDLRGIKMPMIVHYLRYGRAEGRRTNLDIMRSIRFNDRVLKSNFPFIMVGVHECSRTGAPRVGLDLARALKENFNVIFVTLGGGPLLAVADYDFPIVVQASHSPEEAKIIRELLWSFAPFDRAIFSSVGCEPFMRNLAETNVQIGCLVHEFKEEFFHLERSIVMFCDLLVFSSRQLLASWAELIQEVGRPQVRSYVLPQPASGLASRQLSRKDAKHEVAKRIGIEIGDAKLVLGAGLVQMRKGTDIFVQLALDLQDRPSRYVCVWIGKNTHERDPAFGVWLFTQLARSPKSRDGRDVVHFLPPGPLYDLLMDAADVFALPSRLDPLPNVALDAAARGTPVIAFQGATGLVDVADDRQMILHEVPFASVGRMIAAIENARPAPSPSSPFPAMLRAAAPTLPKAQDEYRAYANAIIRQMEAVRKLDHKDEVEVDPAFVGPIMRTRFDEFASKKEIKGNTKLVERTLRLGVAVINPRPGVHSARRPDGALNRISSRWSEEQRIEQLPSSALIHVHAFYPEILPAIFQQIHPKAHTARFVVTTPSEVKAQEVDAAAKKAGLTNLTIILSENAGRDIGPFIDHISPLVGPDDAVCHVHTKKSPEAGETFGDLWRDNMLRSVLSQNAVEFMADQAVGLVIPDNPRNNGWTANLEQANRVAGPMGWCLPYHPGPFPIGNIFWVRGSVLHTMRKATQNFPWPREPIAIDGTVLHAVERLWPLACEQNNKRIAAIYDRSQNFEKPQVVPPAPNDYRKGDAVERREELNSFLQALRD